MSPKIDAAAGQVLVRFVQGLGQRRVAAGCKVSTSADISVRVVVGELADRVGDHAALRAAFAVLPSLLL